MLGTAVPLILKRTVSGCPGPSHTTPTSILYFLPLQPDDLSHPPWHAPYQAPQRCFGHCCQLLQHSLRAGIGRFTPEEIQPLIQPSPQVLNGVLIWAVWRPNWLEASSRGVLGSDLSHHLSSCAVRRIVAMLDHPMPCTMLPEHVLASGQQRSFEDVGILSSHDIVGWLPLMAEVLLMPCLLAPSTRRGLVLPASIRAPMPLVRLKRITTPLSPHLTTHSVEPLHPGTGMRSACGQ